MQRWSLVLTYIVHVGPILVRMLKFDHFHLKRQVFRPFVHMYTSENAPRIEIIMIFQRRRLMSSTCMWITERKENRGFQNSDVTTLIEITRK